jgi:hypothetical protein
LAFLDRLLTSRNDAEGSVVFTGSYQDTFATLGIRLRSEDACGNDEYAAQTFRHWKAGRPGNSAAADAAIRNDPPKSLLWPHERLTPSEVTAILLAYLSGQGRTLSSPGVK